MTRRYGRKDATRLGLAGLAFSMLTAPSAFAQAPPPPATGAENSDEIIVTARKREERLQDVPLTISVISEDAIRDAGIRSALDLAVIAPGLTYELTAGRTNAKPVIRGVTIASTSTNQQKNSSFIDGVYLNGSATPPPFIEVARVEVLKGPQATAFGRSTFSGAINYVMREPTDEMKVSAEFSAATQSEVELGAVIGGPLALDGRLRGQIAAYARSWDGNDDWVSTTGTKLGWEKTEYIAGTLVFEPIDTLKFKLRAQAETADDGPSAVRYVSPAQRNGVFDVTLLTARGAAPAGTRFQQFFPVGEISASTRPYVLDFSRITEPGARVERERVRAEMEWDVLDHTLTVVASDANEQAAIWQTDITNRLCWIPGTTGRPSCAREAQSFDDQQYEVRVASNADGPFSYLLGYSALELSNRSFFGQPVTGALFFSNSIFNQDVINSAWFGAASLKLTDSLTLGGEIRFNRDKVTSLNYSSCTFPASSVTPGANCVIGGVTIANPFTGTPIARPETRSRTFERTLYRATADYKFSDDFMGYLVISRGNQPGGFNLGPTVPAALRVVEEELLDNYEIGFKGAAFDGRLNFNAAYFFMDWQNQTFRRSVQIVNLPDGSSRLLVPGEVLPPGATQATATYTVNEGTSEVQGVEAEANWRATDNLNIRGTLAYTDATLQSFCSEFYFQLTQIESRPGAQCRSVAGNTLEAQPEWAWSLGADYRRAFERGPWSWFARGDYSFTGKKFDSEMNLAWTPPANIANLRVGIDNDILRMEVFATNVTDEDAPVRLARLTDESLGTTAPGVTPTGAAVTVASISRQSVALAPRKERQIGVRIGVSF